MVPAREYTAHGENPLAAPGVRARTLVSSTVARGLAEDSQSLEEAVGWSHVGLSQAQNHCGYCRCTVC
jgi:hypothetical protein